MTIASKGSPVRSRNRRASSITTRPLGDASTAPASPWKYPNSEGTLGTSSTAVTETPQLIAERNEVPIPKHSTSTRAAATRAN